MIYKLWALVLRYLVVMFWFIEMMVMSLFFSIATDMAGFVSGKMWNLILM